MWWKSFVSGKSSCPISMDIAADEDRRKSELAKLEHTKYISPIVYFLPDLFIYSKFYRKKKNKSNKPIWWSLCHICLKFSFVLSESTVPISCQSPGDSTISSVLQHSLQSEYCREYPVCHVKKWWNPGLCHSLGIFERFSKLTTIHINYIADPKKEKM